MAMNLGPKLIAKPSLKQTLTPGLVQMVNILAMNKLELQEAISAELLENPLLDETAEESAPGLDELMRLEEDLRRETPQGTAGSEMMPADAPTDAAAQAANDAASDAASEAATETAAENADAFEEIDYGDFFTEYLDPGFQKQEREDVERPSFDNFLSAPTTLSDHLRWQLRVEPIDEDLRTAAEAIIGNLDEDGYLTAEEEKGSQKVRRPLRVEEIAESEDLPEILVHEALNIVQRFDPPGVAARDLRECLLIQLYQLPTVPILAIALVDENLHALQNPRHQELAKSLNVSVEEIERALGEIRRLDPYPGRRFNPANTRVVEPDVAFVKRHEGKCLICGRESCRNGYQILMNDDGLPNLSLNHQYREMKWNSDQRDASRYVKERYASAIQFLRNLEQRKQTIARVCHSIVERQGDFLDYGLDFLKPMMIKEVAEEIGVHPSTVSRAVANKYVHTTQGVLELRYFFTESVQGTRGAETSLVNLKRRVKRIIEAEDAHHPLTDDRITAMLKEQGIEVTRRTVAKYREDMRIPSTHHRRVRGNE